MLPYRNAVSQQIFDLCNPRAHTSFDFPSICTICLCGSIASCLWLSPSMQQVSNTICSDSSCLISARLSISANLIEKRCYPLHSKYALTEVRTNNTYRTVAILKAFKSEEYSMSLTTYFPFGFNGRELFYLQRHLNCCLTGIFP